MSNVKIYHRFTKDTLFTIFLPKIIDTVWIGYLLFYDCTVDENGACVL